MQICLYGSVLTVMITVMMNTQSFTVLLQKWVSVLWVGLLYIWMSDVFCYVAAVRKSWTQLNVQRRSVLSDVLEFLCWLVGNLFLSICLSIALFFRIQKSNKWYTLPYIKSATYCMLPIKQYPVDEWSFNFLTYLKHPN